MWENRGRDSVKPDTELFVGADHTRRDLLVRSEYPTDGRHQSYAQFVGHTRCIPRLTENVMGHVAGGL